jgi:HSP20 family molecular chaperone IbpA
MSERVPERRSASVDRWEPLRELEQATERMRRMLDDVFGGLGWPPVLGERAGWSPPVDVEETDDAYVVEAELPSVKREDATVELVGNDLQITGEVRERGAHRDAAATDAPQRPLRLPRDPPDPSRRGQDRREAGRRCAHRPRPQVGARPAPPYRDPVVSGDNGGMHEPSRPLVESVKQVPNGGRHHDDGDHGVGKTRDRRLRPSRAPLTPSGGRRPAHQ